MKIPWILVFLFVIFTDRQRERRKHCRTVTAAKTNDNDDYDNSKWYPPLMLDFFSMRVSCLAQCDFHENDVVCCLFEIVNSKKPTKTMRTILPFFLSLYLIMLTFVILFAWKKTLNAETRQLIKVNQPDWTTSANKAKMLSRNRKIHANSHIYRGRIRLQCWLVIFSIRQHLNDEKRWNGHEKTATITSNVVFFRSFVRLFFNLLCKLQT